MSFQSISAHKLFLYLSALWFCFALVVMIFLGEQHVDEGYYHLIAHLTSEGKMPYIDYFYVQMPLYPLIYGFLFHLLGSSFLTGRGISACFALCAFLLASRTARNVKGERAAAVTAGLLACQPFTIYYLTIIKLYALTALLLTCFVWIMHSPLKPVYKTSLAVIFLSLASSVRLTVLPGLFILLLIVFWRYRFSHVFITAALTALLLLGMIILPFYVFSPETFTYGAFTYHFDKESFSLARQFAHRLFTLSQLSQIYFNVILLAAVTIAVNYSFRKTVPQHRISENTQDCLVVILTILFFHFTSQAPYVYRYLTILIPALTVLLGIESVRMEPKIQPHISGFRLSWIFAASCFLTVLSRGAADLGPLTGGGSAMMLANVSTCISSVTSPGAPILTFNNSVAVEAQREVLSGDEMNVLTYDPEWTESRCEKYRVLNLDMLERAIKESRFGAILLTSNSFLGNFPSFYNPGEIGARPRIMAAISTHYYKLKTFPGFGYMKEDADLYLPRDHK
ncbi:hypothetical protein JW979_08965 [bacterium]|nr:hypothetical protein [candidate division CSSED10-310 bacterium]